MKRKYAILYLLAAAANVTAWLLYWNGQPPPSDFTAAEFHDEFKKDRQAAHQRCEGRSLAIRGEVLYVGDSWLLPHDWKFVELGQAGAGEVMCSFSPTTVDQAGRLVLGRVVVIRGVYDGEFGGYPMLKDCVVVR